MIIAEQVPTAGQGPVHLETSKTEIYYDVYRTHKHTQIWLMIKLNIPETPSAI